MKSIIDSFKEKLDVFKVKFSYEDYRQVNNKLTEISLANEKISEQQRNIKKNLEVVKNIINKYVKND